MLEFKVFSEEFDNILLLYFENGVLSSDSTEEGLGVQLGISNSIDTQIFPVTPLSEFTNFEGGSEKMKESELME